MIRMSNKRDIQSYTSQIVILVNLESFYFTHSKRSMSLKVVNRWTLESTCQCLAGSESLHRGKQKKNDTNFTSFQKMLCSSCSFTFQGQ